MKIPDCREAILRIVEQLPQANTYAARVRLAAQLNHIVSEMYRRPPVRRAPTRSKHMTAAMKAKAREMAIQSPDTPMREIGRRLGVDGGRVSEAVAGRRT